MPSLADETADDLSGGSAAMDPVPARLRDRPAGLPLPGAGQGPTAAIIVAMLDELESVASDEEGHGFLSAIGGRIADSHPLVSPESLHALEDQANHAWRGLKWGHARMQARAGGVHIVHSDWPSLLPDDRHGRWAKAFPIILVAIYRQWFAAIGGPADLTTSVTRVESRMIELRYGAAHG